MKSPNVKRIYRTLPKLTPEQYRKVRKLTNRCCNKDRGNCLLLDHGEYVPCIQAHSLSVNCKYFRAAVLPLDRALEKELAGEALLTACKSYTGAENVQIGSYRGFRVELDYDHFQNAFLAVLHGQLRHAVTLGADARGNLTRLDNALSKIPSRIEAANAQLENLHNQQAAAKEELGKPFPQEQELQQKSARLAELDAELSMDGPSEPETPAPEERPSVLKELRERMAQLADSRSGDDLEVAL